ncbi:alpha-ketoglutaric semialdehyde dehydrogenase GucD [Brevibacillus fulvus]|uniref:Aldehyde dehydrogenase (NAD+) n=1 Tax=Brevibacillus fulvus TaxID=1125967 RepID=A0A938Y0L0_9BACL|nr:alpha-ketoglutaric semialdehyde dehydrogenase GucD [Brevibacillus fulvus]MBM7591125.1 aldehyde dehydrogenase (NAD+) [Brevibacillus fulvus]
MSQNVLNYINGNWVGSSSGVVLHSINPANIHERVGTFPDSSEADVDRAVAAAKDAFLQWKALSPISRGQFLHRAADLLEQRVEEIALTATKEMGKTLAETRGEVLRGVAILRYYSQEGSRKEGDVIPSADRRNLLYTQRVPLGVVGVISPWNFPIAIPLWKMAPALIYGNTVVFKPAAETSITAAKIVEVFADAQLPAGVLNLVHGSGTTAGAAIVRHHGVQAITFTGSNQVGKQVAAEAAARGAKFQLEMGGKNPVIVLEDADLELAAELTVSGAMKHTGQKCTATSRCFVHRSVYEPFKQKVLAKVQAIKVGSGLEEGVYMGPLASQKQFEKVISYIEQGKREGAALLYGGKALEEGPYQHGFFVQPTVFENVKNEMVIAQEEIFGPVLCLIKVDSFEEAVEQANATRFGLAASLFTRDLAKALAFVEKIDVGMVKVNGETAGVEPQAAFGGMKDSSSLSREQGQAAVEFFTTLKTVTITPTP